MHNSLTLEIYLSVVNISFVVFQKRRVSRLETVFGWKIHYIDATEYILSMHYVLHQCFKQIPYSYLENKL